MRHALSAGIAGAVCMAAISLLWLAGCSVWQSSERGVDIKPDRVQSTVGIKTNKPQKALE